MTKLLFGTLITLLVFGSFIGCERVKLMAPDTKPVEIYVSNLDDYALDHNLNFKWIKIKNHSSTYIICEMQPGAVGQYDLRENGSLVGFYNGEEVINGVTTKKYIFCTLASENP